RAFTTRRSSDLEGGTEPARGAGHQRDPCGKGSGCHVGWVTSSMVGRDPRRWCRPGGRGRTRTGAANLAAACYSCLVPSLHHYISRAACRARALLPLFALALLGACDSLYADIPRIGSELSEKFGEPPLVHRKDGNALEIV